MRIRTGAANGLRAIVALIPTRGGELWGQAIYFSVGGELWGQAIYFLSIQFFSNHANCSSSKYR